METDVSFYPTERAMLPCKLLTIRCSYLNPDHEPLVAQSQLCSLENREAAARRARDRAQDDVELWREREVEADRTFDERERKRATQKRD